MRRMVSFCPYLTHSSLPGTVFLFTKKTQRISITAQELKIASTLSQNWAEMIDINFSFLFILIKMRIVWETLLYFIVLFTSRWLADVLLQQCNLSNKLDPGRWTLFRYLEPMHKTDWWNVQWILACFFEKLKDWDSHFMGDVQICFLEISLLFL